MKKVYLLCLLGFVLGVFGKAHAQYYSFCEDQIFTIKGGALSGDWLVGIESRCAGQDGGVFGFSGIDYNTSKATASITSGTTSTAVTTPASIRSHYISMGGGMGYNFTDVIGLQDLHPFVGLGMLLSTTIVKDDFSGSVGLQVPVGADYLVTQGVALGAEYTFNHLWNFENSALSGASHEVMLRINFWF